MANHQEITGIILAGGHNRRMGRNKAMVEWRGKKMLDWVYDTISPLCTHVIISSNESIPHPSGSDLVPDIHKGIGPAAGIESGLFNSSTKLNIIVSVDTPALGTGLFSYLINMHGDYEITIPVHNGVNEPMIGIYDRSVLPVFQKAIAEGFTKPPAIIRSCRYQEVTVDESMNFYSPEMFLNLNSPQDLIN
jgi:molybdopterin-guanine dinucleotide biosynthesis protein A